MNGWIVGVIADDTTPDAYIRKRPPAALFATVSNDNWPNALDADGVLPLPSCELSTDKLTPVTPGLHGPATGGFGKYLSVSPEPPTTDGFAKLV
jgi:hypothetical protein